MGWDSPGMFLPLLSGHLCSSVPPPLFPEALHPFHPQNRALCLSPPGPPSLCTVSPGAIHLKGWPLLHTCEGVRVCVWGVGVIWETSVGPLSLAAATKGEGLESQGRDPGPKVGEALTASIQLSMRGSSAFIGARRKPVGVSSPGLAGEAGVGGGTSTGPVAQARML